VKTQAEETDIPFAEMLRRILDEFIKLKKD